MLILQYSHNGFTFKVPMYTFSKVSTGWGGLLLTLGLAALTSWSAYKGHKSVKDKKPKHKNKENEIHFAYYETGYHKLNLYVNDNMIFYD